MVKDLGKDSATLSAQWRRDSLAPCRIRVAVMAVMRSLIAKSLVFCAVMAGWLGGPAAAQEKEKTPFQIEREEKEKEAKRVDQEYKAALERTRKNAVTAPANDPWSNMRGTEDAKTKR